MLQQNSDRGLAPIWPTNGYRQAKESVKHELNIVNRPQNSSWENGPRLFQKPLIIGHAGIPDEALENTAVSIVRAIEVGVDVVEIDVRLTGDRCPICLHDDNLLRVAGVDAIVSKLSYAEVKRLFPSVLRLDEVLAIKPERRIIIDLKTDDESEIREIVKTVDDAKDATARVLFAAHTRDDAYIMRRVHSDCNLAIFGNEGAGDRLIAKEFGAFWIRLKSCDHNKETINQLHEDGLNVITVEDFDGRFYNRGCMVADEAEVLSLVKLGIDGLLVDNPREVIHWMRMDEHYKEDLEHR